MPVLTALLLSAATVQSPAALIVYREYAEPILFAPTLLIDGVVAGKLGQKRSLALAVPAGDHQLELRWPMLASQKRARLRLRLEPGTQRFVEVKALAGFAGGSALIEQDSDTGAQAAARCRPATGGPNKSLE